MQSKNIIIALLLLVALGGGWYVWQQQATPNDSVTDAPSEEREEEAITTEPEPEMQEASFMSQEVLGSSVDGRDITAHHFGNGDTELLFVGGIHGGYEWNTTLVAYKLIDYLADNEAVVPENVRVTVVPVLNPDGLYHTVETAGRFDPSVVPADEAKVIDGRFNANEVDLNRNFDCDWQAVGTWKEQEVSGGSAAFSEPESAAIRDYIEANEPAAVVVWYAAANGVFASSCHNGVAEETSALTNIYADASGYPAYESFDFYAVTGDMVNWLAKREIPAISVLLSNHEDVEWEKNKKGIRAVIEHYAE